MFAKYDFRGNMLLARTVVASGDQRVLDVAHLSDGSIIIAGWIESSVVFGANPDTDLPVSLSNSNNGKDGFITLYDAADAPLGTMRVGGAGDQEVTGLAVLPGDRLVAVGNYTQGATVGGTTLASAGGTDMFILRVATQPE